MAGKTRKTEQRETAVQTFRQFAWNLAGTLAKTRDTAPPVRPR